MSNFVFPMSESEKAMVRAGDRHGAAVAYAARTQCTMKEANDAVASFAKSGDASDKKPKI